MRTTVALLATSLVLALPLAAQTAKPAPPPPAAPAVPVLSETLLKDFFKSQSMMIQSAAAAKEAQTSFQAKIAELQRTCGENATLQMNQSGDPACVAKPTVKK